MALVEVRSLKDGVASAWVDVDGITIAGLATARAEMATLIETERQVSDAVAKSFVAVTRAWPTANPSDLWQHVVYRNFVGAGYSDQQWKRVSGFALERAFLIAYAVPLAVVGIRLRTVAATEVKDVLKHFGLTGAVKPAKVDLFLEGRVEKQWHVFGVAHVKSSIAERIQDDVPASLACMRAGLLSVMLTMDSKSFPPPHGDGVNHGELGGRLPGTTKDRPKRDYVEVDGQFDALFSFNLRTSPSPVTTPSGKRIYTLPFAGTVQPDASVSFVASAWQMYAR
jgi:hypothetical protein